jgi:hypothetical protein
MPILAQTAIITCPHQTGLVTIIPKPRPFFVSSIPILLAPDLIGSPIVGCPIPPPPAGPGPCLTVAVPPMEWQSPLALCMGIPLLIAQPGMMGGMTAGGAPGPLMLKSPGQVLVG